VSELIINPSRACAISGHRVLDKNLKKEQVKELINKIIEKEFDTFLVGMALGFDTLCFNILEDIRKIKPINIIACIPCVEQPEKFNEKQREEYFRMLDSADQKIYVSKNYSSKCMQKRNEFMVDNSSILLAYCIREYGGTANTIKYAIKKDKPIIKVGEKYE